MATSRACAYARDSMTPQYQYCFVGESFGSRVRVRVCARGAGGKFKSSKVQEFKSSRVQKFKSSRTLHHSPFTLHLRCSNAQLLRCSTTQMLECSTAHCEPASPAEQCEAAAPENNRMSARPRPIHKCRGGIPPSGGILNRVATLADFASGIGAPGWIRKQWIPTAQRRTEVRKRDGWRRRELSAPWGCAVGHTERRRVRKRRRGRVLN